MREISNPIDVGNLPFRVTSKDRRDRFIDHGTVESVNLMTDGETGRLCGLGFVDMSSGAQEAIFALTPGELGGSPLTRNPANPREERSL